MSSEHTEKHRGPDPKTVCFAFANGCPRSKASMSMLVEYFKANDWRITTRLKEADMIVFACCGFDVYNEETSFRFLAIVERKKKPGARIVVFGCLSGINETRLLSEFDVTPVPPKSTAKFDEIINARVKIKDTKEPNDLTVYLEQFKECFSLYDRALVKLQLSRIFRSKVVDRLTLNTVPRPLSEHYKHVYEIKIAKGCMGNCSYCAIKFAVGPVRSKPVEQILAEFHSGLKSGYRTFRLIADDVGAYGQDTGTDIAELLSCIFKIPQDFKLLWDDFSPNWLVKYFPRLLKVITDNSNRIGYIGFPIQTGSEKIVKLMNRDYSVSDAKRCIQALRYAAPGLSITTHVLVGFPGEEDADFSDTLKVVKEAGFKDIQAYKYCDRPHTQSALLPGKISERVKTRRIREVRRQIRAVCA